MGATDKFRISCHPIVRPLHNLNIGIISSNGFLQFPHFCLFLGNHHFPNFLKRFVFFAESALIGIRNLRMTTDLPLCESVASSVFIESPLNIGKFQEMDGFHVRRDHDIPLNAGRCVATKERALDDSQNRVSLWRLENVALICDEGLIKKSFAIHCKLQKAKTTPQCTETFREWGARDEPTKVSPHLHHYLKFPFVLIHIPSTVAAVSPPAGGQRSHRRRSHPFVRLIKDNSSPPKMFQIGGRSVGKRHTMRPPSAVNLIE